MVTMEGKDEASTAAAGSMGETDNGGDSVVGTVRRGDDGNDMGGVAFEETGLVCFFDF